MKRSIKAFVKSVDWNFIRKTVLVCSFLAAIENIVFCALAIDAGFDLLLPVLGIVLSASYALLFLYANRPKCFRKKD